MYNALTSFIAAVFMLGTAIFYVLSCVERSVLSLVLGKNKKNAEADIRFTHASLKMFFQNHICCEREETMLAGECSSLLFFANNKILYDNQELINKKLCRKYNTVK